MPANWNNEVSTSAGGWPQRTSERLRTFRDERGWKPVHTPRNLAASISIEAAELLEHFQWRTDEEVERHLATRREDVADELADVAVYLLYLADAVGVDLERAVDAKIRHNESRFPPLHARARSA